MWVWPSTDRFGLLRWCMVVFRLFIAGGQVICLAYYMSASGSSFLGGGFNLLTASQTVESGFFHGVASPMEAPRRLASKGNFKANTLRAGRSVRC